MEDQSMSRVLVVVAVEVLLKGSKVCYIEGTNNDSPVRVQ